MTLGTKETLFLTCSSAAKTCVMRVRINTVSERGILTIFISIVDCGGRIEKPLCQYQSSPQLAAVITRRSRIPIDSGTTPVSRALRHNIRFRSNYCQAFAVLSSILDNVKKGRRCILQINNVTSKETVSRQHKVDS